MSTFHDKLFQLDVDGIDMKWVVAEVHGTESINDPPRFSIVCSPAKALAKGTEEAFAQSLLTCDAKLTWALDSGGTRVFQGVVDTVTENDRTWDVSLVARIGVLEDVVNHRVFVNEDPIKMVKDVVEPFGITVDDDGVQRKPQKRLQCVQAFESDLSFVSRLMAEEGINWYWDPSKKDHVVLVDAPGGFHDATGGPLPIVETGGMVHETSVYDVRLSRRIVPNKVSLRDYDFENPPSVADLRVESLAKGEDGNLERLEYRGHYTKKGLGQTYADIRLDQYRALALTLQGQTNALHLSPGAVVQLQGGPVQQLDGRWLVISVEHFASELVEGEEQRRYHARFGAVPADTKFRPPRPRPPRFGGVQTMDVTGAAGSEIHPDKYGRVKARFRWDRQRPKDDTSSEWCRVVQPPTSGAFLLPRVGWEELVGFWGSSGDVPVLLGRLYTGTAQPPHGLPGNKVFTAFGTLTSPGGGSLNHITMDDTAGNEGMHFNASKDFNERTENDKVTAVKVNESHTVAAKRELIVGEVHRLQVAGSQTHSVAASREVNVDANKNIKAGTEAIAIGGARLFDVGGDYQTISSKLARIVAGAKGVAAIEKQSITITGGSVFINGSSWGQLSGLKASVEVGGVSAEDVGGAKNIKAKDYSLEVKGSLTETFASRTVEAGGDMKDEFKTTGTYHSNGTGKIKGSDVVVKATDEIKIKAGGVTIKIEKSSIEIEGKFDSSQSSVDKNDEDYE